MQGLKLFCSVLLTAVLVQESSCVIWGSKDSSSGVRGLGQRTPRVFDLAAQGSSLEQELEDIASHLKDGEQLHSESRQKRQTVADNIGYTARLGNDSHTHAVVHWTGHPSEYLFIVTRKRNGTHSDESWLWRSTDYGHTFVNETYKLPDSAVIEWYYISPYSEYLIFADIKNSKLYITQDEGESYNVQPIAFKPDRILFQSILAPNSTDGYNRYVLGYDADTQMLWASTDLGTSWTKIGNNVPANRYYWRRLDTDVEGDLSKVYFEMRTNSNSNNSMLFVAQYPYLVDSQPFSRDLGEFQSESLVLEYEYMFVQKPSTIDIQAHLSPLWVSYRRSTTFNQAEFPIGTGDEQYSVIDASEGQVFIAVYHDINTTNLYISEEMGVMYTLSLEYILSPPVSEWIDGNPTFDVHVVEGVVGTYFANLRIPGSRFGSTVVSFDKGGGWTQLSPPAVTRFGFPIVCAPPDCSLHLHMDIDENNAGYQSILSQDSAIGLIMAQGNLGSTLSSSTRDSRLYFSRDGGFTWAEVRTGRWEFQFAALGSVVVAVRKQQLINSVLWTCNEGATWNTTSILTDEFPRGIVVVGMRTEIGEKSRHVTVFGYDLFDGFRWLVIDVNFTSVVPRQCDPEEDYYDWVPTDERPGGRCLLGEVVTHERRNSSVCCFVDPAYEKLTNRTQCTCAIEDFECDFGFERENLNSPCNPLPGVPYPPPPPSDCPETGNYTYSSGYRMVAGDKCLPGKETYFFRRTTPCPILPPEFLVINYTPYPIKAGKAVNFTLSQYGGAKLSTVYTWNFNDSTGTLNFTGFESASSLSHTFAKPGIYNINLTASNAAGSSDTMMSLQVYDILRSVSIVPPSQVFQGRVPTSISLIFTTNMTTVYGTDMLGITGYSWDFDDNSTIVGPDSATVSHLYANASVYNIQLIVYLPFFEDNQDALKIIVYQATRLVDIQSETKNQSVFAFVNTPITFRSVPKQDGNAGEIPADATYTWHIVHVSGTPANSSFTGETLTYTFPTWGQYQITVIGRSVSANADFVGQLSITAEYNITGITISHVTTVRSGVVASFQVSVTKETGDAPYTGLIILSAQNSNGTELDSREVTTDGTPTRINLEVKGRGNTQFLFTAENHISEFEVFESIIAVGTGDYGEVSVIFDTASLPPNYNTTDWQDKLSNSVVNLILDFLDIYKLREFLEVEEVKLVERNTTVKPQNSLKHWMQHKLLKRSQVGVKLLLYVDVNILPVYYTDLSIDLSKSRAETLVEALSNGSYVVLVDGKSIPVSSAHQRTTDGIVIIEPSIVTVLDVQKYAAIGGSLGALLILAVFFTVGLVVIVYFYRRKYSRLNVRYSRLQQTPVRFTFTPGGEMVEEEMSDYDDEDEDDMTNMKMKPN